MELFYPLSPRKAMMLLEAGNNLCKGELTAVSVNSLNILMIRNSHEQLSSDCGHYLKSMAPLIWDEPGNWRVKT